MSRPVAWFSRGAASAVMTKLAIAEYGDDLVVACIALKTEHPDSARFAAHCERWFGRPILQPANCSLLCELPEVRVALDAAP